MQLMKKLLVLLAIQIVFSRQHNRRLKKKKFYPDDTFQEVEFLAKKHSNGQICKLKMHLRENPVELVSSATNFQNVMVLGDQCYCKYHEHGKNNNCEQLLADPQITNSVDVKNQNIIENDKRMNKKKYHKKKSTKHHHHSKKRKNRRFMKRKSIIGQAKQNKDDKERAAELESQQEVQKDNVWWLGMKRYVLSDCETDDEYKMKCLSHCLRTPVQYFDLIETMHTPVHQIGTQELMSQQNQ